MAKSKAEPKRERFTAFAMDMEQPLRDACGPAQETRLQRENGSRGHHEAETGHVNATWFLAALVAIGAEIVAKPDKISIAHWSKERARKPLTRRARLCKFPGKCRVVKRMCSHPALCDPGDIVGGPARLRNGVQQFLSRQRPFAVVHERAIVVPQRAFLDHVVVQLAGVLPRVFQVRGARKIAGGVLTEEANNLGQEFINSIPEQLRRVVAQNNRARPKSLVLLADRRDHRTPPPRLDVFVEEGPVLGRQVAGKFVLFSFQDQGGGLVCSDLGVR